MGFLDKVKDLFTDEEEIIETEEIEVEENEEHKLPTFMRNKIEEEQKMEETRKPKEDIHKNNVVSEREITRTRSNNSFSFPMDLDESDMIPDIGYSSQNVLQKEKEKEKEKKVAELYTKKEEPKPKKFRPTPVISPVYGILDKNYTKDEVKVQDENSYEIQRTSKKVDFESVRNKAFGSLTDDIKNAMCENCELYQEVKIIKNANKKMNKEDVLLTDMVEEPIEVKEDVSISDAEDNYFDFGVAYEPPKKERKNINDIREITSDDIKIVNHNAEESTAEKIEVKEEKSVTKEMEKKPAKKLSEKDLLEDTKEFEKISTDEESINSILDSDSDVSLSEEANDIFNLIDSMYGEEDR